MLASASHYEILEGDRFGPKFAPITKAVCLFFSLWGWGRGGAREHSTIDLLVCLGFSIKKQSRIDVKNVLKRLEMDEN